MRLARERGEVHPERLEDLARVPLELRQLLGLDLPTPHPLPVGAVLFGRVTEVAQGAPSGSLLILRFIQYVLTPRLRQRQANAVGCSRPSRWHGSELGEIDGWICEGGCIDAAPAPDQRRARFVGGGVVHREDGVDQAVADVED